MSRTIKFRAWWPSEKVMEYDFEHDLGNYLTNETELMQFTGFKDRNGCKIYEGDILFSHALDASRTNDDYHIVDGGVSLPAGALLFAHVKNDPLNTPVAFTDTGSLEVIGNIYEHPQLLEVQP